MKTTLLGKKWILHDYEVMFRDHPEASAVTLRFPCPDCDQEFKSLFELKLHHERSHGELSFNPPANYLVRHVPDPTTVAPEEDPVAFQNQVKEEVETGLATALHKMALHNPNDKIDELEELMKERLRIEWDTLEHAKSLKTAKEQRFEDMKTLVDDTMNSYLQGMKEMVASTMTEVTKDISKEWEQRSIQREE